MRASLVPEDAGRKEAHLLVVWVGYKVLLHPVCSLDNGPPSREFYFIASWPLCSYAQLKKKKKVYKNARGENRALPASLMFTAASICCCYDFLSWDPVCFDSYSPCMLIIFMLFSYWWGKKLIYEGQQRTCSFLLVSALVSGGILLL